MISKEGLEQCEAIAGNSTSVRELLDSYYIFCRSHYAHSYGTVYSTIQNFNNQILAGNIDLFADKDTKDFDRVLAYLKALDSLHTDLDSLREKMIVAGEPEPETGTAAVDKRREKHKDKVVV